MLVTFFVIVSDPDRRHDPRAEPDEGHEDLRVEAPFERASQAAQGSKAQLRVRQPSAHPSAQPAQHTSARPSGLARELERSREALREEEDQKERERQQARERELQRDRDRVREEINRKREELRAERSRAPLIPPPGSRPPADAAVSPPDLAPIPTPAVPPVVVAPAATPVFAPEVVAANNLSSALAETLTAPGAAPIAPELLETAAPPSKKSSGQPPRVEPFAEWKPGMPPSSSRAPQASVEPGPSLSADPPIVAAVTPILNDAPPSLASPSPTAVAPITSLLQPAPISPTPSQPPAGPGIALAAGFSSASGVPLDAVDHLVNDGRWELICEMFGPDERAAELPPHLALIYAVARAESNPEQTARVIELTIQSMARAHKLPETSPIARILAKRLLRRTPTVFSRRPAPRRTIQMILVFLALVLGGGGGYWLSTTKLVIPLPAFLTK